jgi:hypothetical protein
MILRRHLGAVALLVYFPFAAWATELVMVEEQGCVWCARWNTEIAPAYPKTDEGQFAPLRRVDIRALPVEFKPTRRVSFTPTFLLVVDGAEVARIEGYPGEDFFWPLLEQMLAKHTDYKGERG